MIVEASPYSLFWGAGVGKRDPRISRMTCWRGANKLGQIWMEIRRSARGKTVESEKEIKQEVTTVFKITQNVDQNRFGGLEDEWKEAEDGPEGEWVEKVSFAQKILGDKNGRGRQGEQSAWQNEEQERTRTCPRDEHLGKPETGGKRRERVRSQNLVGSKSDGFFNFKKSASETGEEVEVEIGEVYRGVQEETRFRGREGTEVQEDGEVGEKSQTEEENQERRSVKEGSTKTGETRKTNSELKEVEETQKKLVQEEGGQSPTKARRRVSERKKRGNLRVKNFGNFENQKILQEMWKVLRERTEKGRKRKGSMKRRVRRTQTQRKNRRITSKSEVPGLGKEKSEDLDKLRNGCLVGCKKSASTEEEDEGVGSEGGSVGIVEVEKGKEWDGLETIGQQETGSKIKKKGENGKSANCEEI